MREWLQALLLRLRAITRRDAVERELDEELADHLERETEELMARARWGRDFRFHRRR